MELPRFWIVVQLLIVIFVLYGIVLFAFGWFGGWRAAGKSVEDWGRWNSALRRRAGSS